MMYDTMCVYLSIYLSISIYIYIYIYRYVYAYIYIYIYIYRERERERVIYHVYGNVTMTCASNHGGMAPKWGFLKGETS